MSQQPTSTAPTKTYIQEPYPTPPVIDPHVTRLPAAARTPGAPLDPSAVFRGQSGASKPHRTPHQLESPSPHTPGTPYQADSYAPQPTHPEQPSYPRPNAQNDPSKVTDTMPPGRGSTIPRTNNHQIFSPAARTNGARSLPFNKPRAPNSKF